MNLKESFRYQNFLEFLMQSASASIMQKDHCLVTRKLHHKDEGDVPEEVTTELFIKNDIVLAFMEHLVEEKGKLTQAIGIAKRSIGFDLDAAIETNKFRQLAATSVKKMLVHTPSQKTEQGRAYKFNNEGNQMPYVYDVEVTTEDNYDRTNAKNMMKNLITGADIVSSEIDAAMVNTTVVYSPLFDVNDSFEDAVELFVQHLMDTEE